MTEVTGATTTCHRRIHATPPKTGITLLPAKAHQPTGSTTARPAEGSTPARPAEGPRGGQSKFSTSKTPKERRQVSNGGLWKLSDAITCVNGQKRDSAATLQKTGCQRPRVQHPLGRRKAHGVGNQERRFYTSKIPTESRQVSNGGLWCNATKQKTGCQRPAEGPPTGYNDRQTGGGTAHGLQRPPGPHRKPSG
jgi:hypothetical protein